MFDVLAELQGFIFLVFLKRLRTAGNRRSSLPDRLCYPDNFDHSHQITHSEKMLIIATRRNGIGNCILASLPQFTEEQLPLIIWLENYYAQLSYKLFYLTCTSTGSLSDQFYQVSIAYTEVVTCNIKFNCRMFYM